MQKKRKTVLEPLICNDGTMPSYSEATFYLPEHECNAERKQPVITLRNTFIPLGCGIGIPIGLSVFAYGIAGLAQAEFAVSSAVKIALILGVSSMSTATIITPIFLLAISIGIIIAIGALLAMIIFFITLHSPLILMHERALEERITAVEVALNLLASRGEEVERKGSRESLTEELEHLSQCVQT